MPSDMLIDDSNFLTLAESEGLSPFVIGPESLFRQCGMTIALSSETCMY